MNSPFVSSIVLGDNESSVILADIIAPIGEPAVTILGDDADLIVTAIGSLAAPDAGNSAVVSSGEGTFIFNGGEISGDLNGISSTGDDLRLINGRRGVITSNSRAVDLAGGDNLFASNSGTILGTGDQRNGTFYIDGDVDEARVINGRRGIIDAGEGNLGDGLSVQVGAASEDAVSENINISNAGLIAGRGQPLFENGARVNANGSSGLRFFNGSGEVEATLEGRIFNSGTITSEAEVGFLGGLVFEDGVAFEGSVFNSRTGIIEGPQNGVYFGEADHTNGVFTNAGLVASGSRALNIDGTGLTVNNSGTFLGTDNQRNGTVYADGTAQDFTFNNRRRGAIDAGEGNEGSGFGAEIGAEGNTFTLDNAGTIAGRGNAAAATNAAGDGVRVGNVGNAGTANATITNSGTITSEGENGTVAGLRVVDGVGFQGTLTNTRTGVISGPQNGVYFGEADHTGGVFDNAGLVASGSRALNIDGTGLTVNNSGTFLGTASQRNGTVYADGTAQDFTFNNNRRGVIDAGEGNEGSGFGAEIGAEGNTFTLNNAGTIQGRGNADAGTNAAGDGVRIGNVGNVGIANATIANSGTITSEGANGTVAGVRFVNGISFQGTFANSGTIAGVQNGVYFGNPVEAGGGDHTGGVFNNLAGGSILSDSRAFNIDGIGLTVNNAGTIAGTDDQRNGTVYADGTAQDFTFNNLAGGIIDAGEGNEGSGFGAEIGAAGNAFTLDNAGTIAGRGNAAAATNAAGDGVRIGNVGNVGTANATITNSGSITSEGANGTVAGLRVVDGVGFEGTITNTEDGVISGPQNGFYIGNAEHDLFVLNAGTITSGSRAVNLDGDFVEFVNRGDVLGTGDQRNGTLYIDGTGDDITVVNATEGVIDAGEHNSGSGVSVQVGAVGDPQNDNINIVNDGLIQGRGIDNVPAGVRLFVGSGLHEATFNGSIENQANGVIASEEVAGILIEAGVIFDGEIINDGLIVGGNGIAIDAAGALGAVEVINNGELIGDVLLGQGDDTFTQSSAGETAIVEGGAGSDIFSVQAGTLIVEDFVDGEDILNLDAFFSSGAEALAAARQEGDATVFDLGVDASLVLDGFAEANLSEASFDFA